MAGPLLVVDGDSFAHRAYHAPPKTIRRCGDKGGGAIVGFANSSSAPLTRKSPRAVLVGWDTLEAPTYRHEALEGYQAGRAFDDELVEQLAVLPAFVAACGFAMPRRPDTRPTISSAAAVARPKSVAAPLSSPPATATPSSSPSARTMIPQPIRWRGGAHGPAEAGALRC